MPCPPRGSRAQCQLKHPPLSHLPAIAPPQLNWEVELKGEALETAGHMGLKEKGTHKPNCTVCLFVSWRVEGKSLPRVALLDLTQLGALTLSMENPCLQALPWGPQPEQTHQPHPRGVPGGVRLFSPEGQWPMGTHTSAFLWRRGGIYIFSFTLRNLEVILIINSQGETNRKNSCLNPPPPNVLVDR